MIEKVLTARFVAIDEQVFRLYRWRATKDNGDSRRFDTEAAAQEWLYGPAQCPVVQLVED